MTSEIDSWEIGDRLINHSLKLQATIHNSENGLTLGLSDGSVLIAKRITLEKLGWVILQKKPQP